MKKKTYKNLSVLFPIVKAIYGPKYSNFGGLEDYSKVVEFAEKHPDIQITEQLKNKLMSE